jgi:Leucine-rich repeat (LRR) protein
VLNLFDNRISVLENIPQSCIELYLDFNQLTSCKIKKPTALELLSLSHNKINDRVLQDILSQTPSLRCLNIAYNQL